MSESHLPPTDYQKEHQKMQFYNVDIYILLSCLYIILIFFTAVSSTKYFGDSTLTITDNKKIEYYRVVASPESQNAFFKDVTQNSDIPTENTKLVSSEDWKKAPHGSNKHVRNLTKTKFKNYSKIKNTVHETLSYSEVPTCMLTLFIIDFLFISFFRDKLLQLKIYSIIVSTCKFITIIPLLFYIVPTVALKIFSNDSMSFYSMFELHPKITTLVSIIYVIAMLISLLDTLGIKSNKSK